MCSLAIRIKRQQETDSVAIKGPLHMSTVGRAGPVSEILPSRLYERAGWLSSRDLSVSDRDLGMQAAGKSKFLYLAMFASFLEFRARTRRHDLCHFFISETGLKFLI